MPPYFFVVLAFLQRNNGAVVKKTKNKSKSKSKLKSKLAPSSVEIARQGSKHEVLFRPERLKYVRQLVKSESCVFCAALDKGPSPDSLLLFSDEHSMIILNKYPYNNGHLLVLPRRHCGDFLNLSDEEHRYMNLCLKRALRALKTAYNPIGFNVGLNLGAAAGAGIPDHLHYHVIPRWSGDTNFFPLIAGTKVVVETLEQTYRHLLPYLSEG
jgi:ATP adenylyltransferase